MSIINRHIKNITLCTLLLTLIACSGMSEQQMLQNAKTYITQGKLRAATLELRNILQENSDNAEARYLLGNINMKVGDYTSAEKDFRSAADAGWNKEDITLQFARIYTYKHDFKKLIEEIQVMDDWSVKTRANIAGLRALAEARLNDMTQARNTLSNGRTLDENAINILSTTAILQLAGKLEGKSSDTLKKARSLYPDEPEILLIHAANDVQNDKVERATDTYIKVISLDPDNIITMNGRRARISLTRLYIVDKKYSEASQALNPLLKVNSKDPETNYLAGLLAFTQGEFNLAEDHIRELIAIAPNNIQAQQLMGKIKYALEDYDQAALHLSNYLAINTNDNSVRKLLTNTLIILNQQDQARETLQPILSSDPGDVTALTLLSQIEFNSNNKAAGIAAIKQAISTSPNNAQLHKNLAKAYIETGETQLAKNELSTYKELSGDSEGAQKLTISAYLQAGQIEKALNTAKESLTKNPENIDTLVLIGNLYASQDDNQTAREYYKEAMQIHDDHPAATMGLARIERKTDNIDSAITLYKSLVDSNTAGTNPMLALSEIAAQQNRINDMIAWLEKARNKTPKEIRARMILAQHYLNNARPEKAEIYTKEAIKSAPELGDLITLHSKILIAQKRYSEALPPLKKLESKSPESLTTQILLGEIFLRQQLLTNARQHLQQALTIQHNNLIATSLLAETELKSNNPAESLKHAKTLQREQPDSHRGYMQEGDVWLVKKNNNKAYSAYKTAWDKQQSPQLAQKLFIASKDISSFDESIKPLHTWLKNNPDDHSVLLYLATIYQSTERNKKAIEQYEKVLKLTPRNSTVLNNLAWLHSLDNNPKALDMAERAYRISPSSPDILDTYGWILIKNDQAAKGFSLIEQAKNILPDNPDIAFHYAVALIKTGKVTEGKDALHRLLKIDKPFHSKSEAEKLLETL